MLATVVDGNVAGRVNGITDTVTNFAWAPGTDIWLRWADPQVAGSDDGLAIDDVSFSADAGGIGPAVITSVTSGPAASGSTWSNNQPPSAGSLYHVQSGHTVDVSTPFPGAELRTTNGATVNFSASGVYFPYMSVDTGGNVTKTASGDFGLGDINAPTLGTFNTNQALTFSMDAGSDFFLDVHLIGSGDLNFNSNGSGSDLWLTDAGSHAGTIRFNGTGDQVQLVTSSTFHILEMNSTGQNEVVYDALINTSDAGTVIFNQPGIILHKSNFNRLQSPATLVANAAVTVDISAPIQGRFRTSVAST